MTISIPDLLDVLMMIGSWTMAAISILIFLFGGITLATYFVLLAIWLQVARPHIPPAPSK